MQFHAFHAKGGGADVESENKQYISSRIPLSKTKFVPPIPLMNSSQLRLAPIYDCNEETKNFESPIYFKIKIWTHSKFLTKC